MLLVKFAPFTCNAKVACPAVTELGLSELIAGAGVTVKAAVLLVPPAVVTVTAPLLAPAPIAKLAVICVALTTTGFTTVMPAGGLIVPPVNPVPVRMTGTVAPAVPAFGAIDVSVGETVKMTALLVPPGVVTVTLPELALAASTKLAVICVALTTVGLVTVIPEGALITVAPMVSPAPVRVTGTVAPAAPELGAMEVSPGVTVKVTALLVPPGVVTVTLPELALAAITKLAVT